MRQARDRGLNSVPSLINEPPAPWRLAPLAILVLVALTALDPMVRDAVSALPASVRAVARALTEVGQATWYLVPTALVALLAPLRARRMGWRARTAWRQLGAVALYMFVSIGLTGLSATIIKHVIGRARPSVADSEGFLAFRPVGIDPHWASLPSGHATVLFAVALTAGVVWPRARIWLLVVATCLASTRVLVGAHHLADVLAALLLAVLGTSLIARAFVRRRVALCRGPDGALALRGRRIWRMLLPQRVPARVRS